MVLELAVLHVLNKRQIELGNIVLVHVEQNVSDHHDTLLNLFPYSVKLTKELLLVSKADILSYRLQQLYSGLLHTFVKHLTMLVEHKIVSRAIKLFVAKRTRLLAIDLVDGVLDGFPMLLGLRALHIGIAHFVTINQKLVMR